MKNTMILAALLLLANFSFARNHNSDAKSTEEKIIAKQDTDLADRTIAKFKKANPAVETFLETSAAYVVYPKIGKGGVGIEVAWGKGLVYEKGVLGIYSLVGYSEITQAAVGLVLGGKSYSEIVFLENKRALKDLKRGKLKFNAQASAVAGDAASSKNKSYKDGVAIFTHSDKGLMGELAVGVQNLSFIPAKKK